MYQVDPGAREEDIGFVEHTDTATHAITKGQYVIWKGALKIASSNIAVGDTLSSSNLTDKPNGLGQEVAELNAHIGTIDNSLIKYQSFAETGTTASTAGTGGMYKASVFLPSVTGTVLGIIVTNCFDTQYFDSNVLYSIYNATTITLWTGSANRGVKVQGYILYV